MKIVKKILFAGFFLLTNIAFSQDDLMDMLDEEGGDDINYTIGSFKATRIVSGQSIETRNKGGLDFLISHRFGRLNTGSYELFGLDESNIRLALEYGVTDKLNVGIGRSSFEKTYDAFVKYKLFAQSTGDKSFPVTITTFSSITNKSLRFDTTAINHNFGVKRTHYYTSRLAFTNQLLIARKINDNITLQLSPTLVHRNLVYTIDDPNDIYAMGMGGRYKFTPSFSINGEYFYQLNQNQSVHYFNSAAIAFELETGGHVFQLGLSNSRAMIEKGFITETSGDVLKGDIHFGFNIFRTF